MPKRLSLIGGKPLTGHIKVGGAKNAVSKMMIASLLTDEPMVLDNVPAISEVEITTELLQTLGTKVERDGSTMILATPKITNTTVEQLSRSNRLPILALSPLLNRAGEAEVPTVGGDAIGPRPVNFHIEALKVMGATIKETAHGYHATTTGLKGAKIDLPYPSVGATENIILAAVLAKGRTLIRGAATEPEIGDLVRMLQRMGAIIEFGANRTVIIDGVAHLHGTRYKIMGDRLEAASFALLGIATGGEVTIEGIRQDELMTFLNTVRRIGADYAISERGIKFKRGTQLRGIELETDTYPGFATDWQQPTVVLLTQAKGVSVVHETVYEDRFGYTEALVKMGADISVFNKCLGELPCRFQGRGMRHSVVIKGPTALHAADNVVPDIRAGMAHVIAALLAEGESHLTGIEHLLRGYEHFIDKLESIGAQIKLD